MKNSVLIVICISAFISLNAFASPERDLSEAVKANDAKKITELMKDNPKLADKDIEFFGYPLLYALENKKYSAVEALLAAGASANVKDEGGENAFHCLARAGSIDKATLDKLIEFIKILKGKSCNINACSNAGFTPLHLAVMTNCSMKGIENNKALIEALIANGADFKTEPKDEKKIPLLLQVIGGMRAGQPDKDGVIAIQGAESFELMKDLIDKGYNVNVMDPTKTTALITLLKLNIPEEPKIEMIKYLLEHKANPKLKNKANEKPLDMVEKKTPIYNLLKNPPKPVKKK